MTTETETYAGGAVAKMTVPTLTMMVAAAWSVWACSPRPAWRRDGILVADRLGDRGHALMLAFVFQNLAIRKPELDLGVFHLRQGRASATTSSFNSAIGFWASDRGQHVHRCSSAQTMSTVDGLATATPSSRSPWAASGGSSTI